MNSGFLWVTISPRFPKWNYKYIQIDMPFSLGLGVSSCHWSFFCFCWYGTQHIMGFYFDNIVPLPMNKNFIRDSFQILFYNVGNRSQFGYAGPSAETRMRAVSFAFFIFFFWMRTCRSFQYQLNLNGHTQPVPTLSSAWESRITHIQTRLLSYEEYMFSTWCITKCESNFFSVHICLFLWTTLQHRSVITGMKAEIKDLQQELLNSRTPRKPSIVTAWHTLTFPGWTQHQLERLPWPRRKPKKGHPTPCPTPEWCYKQANPDHSMVLKEFDPEIRKVCILFLYLLTPLTCFHADLWCSKQRTQSGQTWAPAQPPSKWLFNKMKCMSLSSSHSYFHWYYSWT